MRQRQGPDEDVAGIEIGNGAEHAAKRSNDVGMGQYDPFGVAGGSGGVHDHSVVLFVRTLILLGHCVRPHFGNLVPGHCLDTLRLVGDQCGNLVIRLVPPLPRWSWVTGEDNVLQIVKFVHNLSNGGHKCCICHHVGDLGLCQTVLQRLCSKTGVHCGNGETTSEAGLRSHLPVIRRICVDADVLPLLHPKGRQSCTEVVNLLLHFLIREPLEIGQCEMFKLALSKHLDLCNTALAQAWVVGILLARLCKYLVESVTVRTLG
mmetsp:Transcript_16424/g.28755  ORF Transcript_16424/g.28755 Transcript_16424/m.28755 type:complete len:262 (-) Transcript_16424:265-1050(-)